MLPQKVSGVNTKYVYTYILVIMYIDKIILKMIYYQIYLVDLSYCRKAQIKGELYEKDTIFYPCVMLAYAFGCLRKQSKRGHRCVFK